MACISSTKSRADVLVDRRSGIEPTDYLGLGIAPHSADSRNLAITERRDLYSKNVLPQRNDASMIISKTMGYYKSATGPPWEPFENLHDADYEHARP